MSRHVALTITIPECYSGESLDRLADSFMLLMTNCVVVSISGDGSGAPLTHVALEVVPPSFYPFDELQPMLQGMMLRDFNIVDIREVEHKVSEA